MTARAIRRSRRREKIRGVCSDQIVVGDAANKLRTLRMADIHKIDKRYEELKSVQWAELLDAWDEFYRGSGYLPKTISHAIEAVHLAFIQNRMKLNGYFDPEAIEDL